MEMSVLLLIEFCYYFYRLEVYHPNTWGHFNIEFTTEKLPFFQDSDLACVILLKNICFGMTLVIINEYVKQRVIKTVCFNK